MLNCLMDEESRERQAGEPRHAVESWGSGGDKVEGKLRKRMSHEEGE